MGNVYSAEGNRRLLLYPYEKRIYMRSLQGGRAEKAVILANDYLEDLSDVFYQNTIYYSYINQQKETIVKNILEQKVIFSSSHQSGLEYFCPILEVMEERLILFCFMKNPLDQKYLIKGFFPLQGEEFLLPNEYDEILQKELGCIPEAGVFFLKEEKGITFWKLQWKEDKCKIQRQYFKSQSELEKVVKEMGRRNQVIREKDLLIENIKMQYEELMQTAVAYREEAMRWRDRYYGSKNKILTDESEKSVK